MALVVSAAAGRSYAVDTLLGVASHAALAVGLVALSFLQGVRVDLIGFLFGDILAVARGDLVVIYAGAAAVVGLVVWRWRALLLATLSEDLAASAGIDPRRERLILTLALALLVAVSLKVVGALLVTAMLIVPAAAARAVARSPGAMAVAAAALGALAAVAGLLGSWRLDTPAGPSIVVAAVVLLLAANAVGALRQARA
jgi:zinc transport system permease protein